LVCGTTNIVSDKMNKFKITFNDIFGAFVDIAFMAIRPTLFWLVWKYGISANSNIPELDFLQVISIIVIFNILVSYVPIVIKPSDDN